MKIQRLDQVTGGVSRETAEGLVAFEAEFRKWASRINLVADSTLDAVWERHIIDSAQLFSLAPSSLRWLDLGSGGGFPGLVLAFLLKDRPGGVIDLVESNRKKSGFLQAMIGQFRLPARVHAVRIEDVGLEIDPEVVTARALAPLDRLFPLTARWLGTGATGLFHKGRDYRIEIEETAHHWTHDLVEHVSKVDPDGVVLEMRHLARRG